MKKIGLLLLFVSTTMFSQKLTKEQLNQKLATNICECMGKIDLETSDFNTSLEGCMMDAINKNQKDVEAIYGKNILDNEEGMYKFGTEIGKVMGKDCPEVFMSMMDEGEDEEYVEEDELIFEGKLALINKTQQFLTFSVKATDGSSKEFIVMEEFDGVDLITTDKVKVNDKVELAYYESEMYDPKTKKFKLYNVVYNISKL